MTARSNTGGAQLNAAENVQGEAQQIAAENVQGEAQQIAPELSAPTTDAVNLAILSLAQQLTDKLAALETKPAEPTGERAVREVRRTPSPRKPYKVPYLDGGMKEDRDIYISCNGERVLVKPGNTVMLTEAQIEIVENSMRQRRHAIGVQNAYMARAEEGNRKGAL